MQIINLLSLGAKCWYAACLHRITSWGVTGGREEEMATEDGEWKKYDNKQRYVTQSVILFYLVVGYHHQMLMGRNA